MITETIPSVQNKMCFEWKHFNEKFVYRIKQITNPNGQGNCAYKPDILPQDDLVKAYGWVHGNTGLTCQFEWQSGRKDAYCIADIETKENTEFSDIFKAIFLQKNTEDFQLITGEVHGH